MATWKAGGIEERELIYSDLYDPFK